jgi:hypothetical protein
VPAAVVLLLAGAPLLVVLLVPRCRLHPDRPAAWPGRALAISISQAAACSIAVASGFNEGALVPWIQIGLPGLVAVLPVVAAVLAVRSLRHPLSPELGELDVEMRVAIRVAAPGVPQWFTQDQVRLTRDELIALFRPSAARAAVMRIALTDVTGVAARPVRSQDNPWITLPDGDEYYAPSGDVIVIRHKHGTNVLPVNDAKEFAEVLRIRAARAQKATIPASNH